MEASRPRGSTSLPVPLPAEQTAAEATTEPGAAREADAPAFARSAPEQDTPLPPLSSVEQSATVAAHADVPAGIPEADTVVVLRSASEQDLSDDLLSTCSELDCPVCYQVLCEPVKAGCGRHVFCKNCLVKSQKLGMNLRCPICRAESEADAANMSEDDEMVQVLMRRDPQYLSKAAVASKDREDLVRLRRARAMAAQAALGVATSAQLRLSTADTAEPLWPPEARETLRVWIPCSHGTPPREVHGAGVQEVNGVYVAGALSTYVGPTVYRKPDTRIFMFRWHRTQWVIAELRGPYSLGDECEWMYRASTQNPPDAPPRDGWQVSTLGRAHRPAPSVHLAHPGSTVASSVAARSAGAPEADTTRRVDPSATPHAGDTVASVLPRAFLQQLGRLTAGAAMGGSVIITPSSEATQVAAGETGSPLPENHPETGRRRHVATNSLHLNNAEVRPGASCGCTPCVVM